MSLNTMTSSKEFNKIILAVDGSDASKKAAQKAFSIAKKTGIDVVVIYVMYFPIATVPTLQSSDMSYINDVMKKQGQAILNEIERMASEHDVKIQKVLAEGIPDDEIIKLTHKNDLIIMGSKGHSTLDRILIGSVSENVLHHSKAAVMIIR
jgi:nucleotide-binding universal stress UspA family protein